LRKAFSPLRNEAREGEEKEARGKSFVLALDFFAIFAP
jgi:hypothetical protein